jgi:chemotaxis protein CheD
MGARRSDLEAKVFGGGNVLDGLSLANVGERNAAFVLGFLALENIPLVARDLLGSQPRKVCFFPRTGRVLVKKLGAQGSGRLATREAAFLQKLRGSPVGGDVELFA